jgi:hypothetical protein
MVIPSSRALSELSRPLILESPIRKTGGGCSICIRLLGPAPAAESARAASSNGSTWSSLGGGRGEKFRFDDVRREWLEICRCMVVEVEVWV